MPGHHPAQTSLLFELIANCPLHSQPQIKTNLPHHSSNPSENSTHHPIAITNNPINHRQCSSIISFGLLSLPPPPPRCLRESHHLSIPIFVLLLLLLPLLLSPFSFPYFRPTLDHLTNLSSPHDILTCFSHHFPPTLTVTPRFPPNSLPRHSLPPFSTLHPSQIWGPGPVSVTALPTTTATATPAPAVEVPNEVAERMAKAAVGVVGAWVVSHGEDEGKVPGAGGVVE